MTKKSKNSKKLNSIRKNIIVFHNGEHRISSWEIYKETKVQHKYIKRLLQKYEDRFLKRGILMAINSHENIRKKDNSTWKVDEVLINEAQAYFLMTLLKNTDKVVEFKDWLISKFTEMKIILVKQKNAEWLQKRAEGKIVRRFETDAIKLFIEYAKEQGSKSANKYYMIITKMENTTLFNLEFIEHKYDNLRNMLNGFSLNALQVADHIVGKALKEGIQNRLYYKDIYQLAKSRIESFAESMGKIVPQLEFTETRTIGKHV